MYIPLKKVYLNSPSHVIPRNYTSCHLTAHLEHHVDKMVLFSPEYSVQTLIFITSL